MRTSRLHQILSFLLVFCGYFSTQAAYLHNVPISIEQPNGTVIAVFATGDEFYYRIHDAQNFTITRDPLSGFYVYANLAGDELVATSLIVGQSDPALSTLTPGLNISAEKQQQMRKSFLAATPVKPPLDLAPSGPLAMGTINNLVVYIRFSDQTNFSTLSSVYNDMFNSTVPGYNSMYNYFREASFENLSINSSFYPPPVGPAIISYQDSHARSYYMPYNAVSNPDGYQSSQRTEREHTLLVNAVNYVSSVVPAGLDIDHDMDGYVDNVCFVIKGGTTAWSTLLWPHRWSLYSQTVYIQGKRVWDYNFQLEDFLSGSGNGVLCHEMFHTLGAPDLYHYNGDGNTPVGSWDIMESTTNPPQSMGAFMKHKYGSWISYIPPITVGGEYTLNPITSSTNNCYKMFSTASSTEYFVFEYRNKEGPFESSIPASGLLIYRISTTAGDGNADGPPDEVYLYRPGGTTTANGTINQAHFSLDAGRNKFSNISNPNCFFSNGVLANIDISNVGNAIGTISFTVNIGTVTNFSASKTETCPNSTVQLTDQTTGGPSSWIWTVTPATHLYVNGTSSSSQNPQIQFTSPGQYTISLLANGPGGPNVKVLNNYITALALQNPPFTDNFESGSLSANHFTIKNPDNSTTWNIYNGVGGNDPGTKAVFMDFRDYGTIGQKDYLILPPVNLSSYGSAQMTFKVAYRPYDANHHDSLRVVIYTQCGDTYFGTPYNKSGTILATGSATTTEFIPTVASHWRTESINLNPYIGQIILVKFEAVNGNGNNLYIDDISVTGSAPISSNFTANNTTICSNSSVVFTDLSSGSPTSWFWNFGDGTSSTQQHPTHIYSTPGTYNVTLTVYKSSLTNSTVKTNYIQVNPQIVSGINLIQSPPGPQCTGTTLTFTAETINPGNNPVYQWKRNNINIGTNSPTYTASNFNNGETMKCTMTSDAGCVMNNPVSSGVLAIQISLSLIPSVSITTNASQQVCQNSEVIFTANPMNGGTNPQYTWFKNGSVVGSDSPVYSDNALSDGDSIRCRLVSNIGCVSNSIAYSAYKVMEVIPSQTVGISISSNSSGPVCSGDPVTFTAAITSGGNQPAFQWKRNGVVEGQNSTTFTTNSLIDGDMITCQVLSNLACAANNPAIANPMVMQVNPKLPFSVIIESNPPMPVCQGSSVTFSTQAYNAGSNPSYKWRRNNILVGTNPTYTIASPTNNQVITCEMTSSETCVSNSPDTSNSITTVVNSSQPLTVSISASTSNTICSGTPVTFTANVNQPGTSPQYQWKINNVTVSTEPAFTTNTLAHGNQVKCVVTSDAPCIFPLTATSNTITMSILPQYAVSVNIAADPPGVVCEGTPVIYLAYPENGGNNPDISWLKNGEPVANGFIYVPDIQENGDIIKCIMVSSQSGCLNGNPAKDSVFAQVQPLPHINLGNDTIIPEGAILLLDPGNIYTAYQWNTGSLNPTLTVTETGTYSVTVTDFYGCSGDDEIGVIVGFGSLAGTVNYFNAAGTPMSNVPVKLMNGNIQVKETTTNGSGYYQFQNIVPGNYTLKLSTTRPWGGVNSSDALLTLKHFVGISLLSGLKMTAGDVNTSSQINSQDALYIQRRYINQISSFPAPDWLFENPSIAISSSVNSTQNIKAICSGDVNGSYSLPAKHESNVFLKPLDLAINSQSQRVELPVMVNQETVFAAVSLRLVYDPSILKAIHLTTENPDQDGLLYSMEEGLILISWISNSNLKFKTGEALFNIHFEIRDIEKLSESGISIMAAAESEIADENGNPYELINLIYPSLVSFNQNNVFNAGHYPNPSQRTSTFWVNLPEKSRVNIRISDVNSALVYAIDAEEQESGIHTWNWEAVNQSGSPVKPGVYYYTIETGEHIRSGKLVLIR